MRTQPFMSMSRAVWGSLVLPGLVALALLAGFLLTDLGKLPLDRLDYGWLIAVGPALGLLGVYAAWRRRRALQQLTSPALAGSLCPQASSGRAGLQVGLVACAAVATTIALMGPRWGVYLEKREAYGVDVVVAMDVSRSMLAHDLDPSRLAYAKQQVRTQLTERNVFGPGNRLGLLAFAGNASMKVPLSLDHGFFRTAVDQLNLGSAPRGGTALAEAIYEAANFFSSSPEEATKVILLLTDGEDHEGDPVAAAQHVAEEYGVRVFTVGVGDPTRSAGAEVPSGPEPGSQPLVYDGQIVYSKLNEPYLRSIAEAGGGMYSRVSDFHRLVDALAQLEKHQLTTEEREQYVPRYQWFAAAALVLLTIETLLAQRRTRTASATLRRWTTEAGAE